LAEIYGVVPFWTAFVWMLNIVGTVLAVGIDGCRGGWIIATRPQAADPSTVSFSLVTQLDGLFAEVVNTGGMVAIDIPIGLSGDSIRNCDREARAFLGQPRGSSVFPAPSRSCLGASTYAEACERSLAARGMMISQQCYGILPKIGEVDASMSAERQRSVREAHPEVTFAALAGFSMSHSKRTKEGMIERLEILRANGLLLTLDQIQKHRAELGRGKAHVDDIIDAAACLMTAERIARGEHRIFGGQMDSRNLRMEIDA
jgi:predicted RNase H-like nuclease